LRIIARIVVDRRDHMYAATPTMRIDRLINLDFQAGVMKDMAVDDRERLLGQAHGFGVGDLGDDEIREGKVEVYASGGRDRARGVMRRSPLAFVGTVPAAVNQESIQGPGQNRPYRHSSIFNGKNVTTAAFRV